MPSPKPKPVVYFVQAGHEGPIKIGTSNNVNRRMYALQNGQSVRLCLLGTVPGDRVIEQHWHARFAASRLRGEWFKPDDALMDAIEEHVMVKTTWRCKWGEPFGPPYDWRTQARIKMRDKRLADKPRKVKHYTVTYERPTPA